MRQHKLALCPEHFIEWFQRQTQRMIETYKMLTAQERILVAVSGGKDSLALWDVLLDLGYQAHGLYIDLGIDSGLQYSLQSRRLAEKFAEARGANLIRVDIREQEGATIPEAARLSRRGRDKPCSVCGITKRTIMNRVALDQGFDVVATGHNLDDEAAALLGNTLSWQVGYLRRQGPVLQADPRGFVRKVKPFFRCYERDVAAYAFLRQIAYIQEECPFAEDASSLHYKELLNQMEARSPGRKMYFLLTFIKAKEQGLFHGADQETLPSARLDLHPCQICGQPTSAEKICSYCRTWRRVRQEKQSLTSQ